MRSFLSFLLAFLSISTAFAQDQLYKKDNSKTEVKVLEVTPTEIRYKLFTYQDGPVITVLKSDVALIIYQNGTHETFNVAPPPPVTTYRDDRSRDRSYSRAYDDSLKRARFREAISTKNLVSLNLLEPLNGSLGASYLREFAGGLFDVYVPLTVGFTEPYLNQPYNVIWSPLNYGYGVSNARFKRKTGEIGLAVHAHTSGKHAITHIIGPSVAVSQFTGSYDVYTGNSGYYPPQSQPSYFTQHFVMNRYTFMLDNGILFRIHKNFNMMLLAGFGYHSDVFISGDPKAYYPYNYGSYRVGFPINSFKLNMSVGYRF